MIITLLADGFEEIEALTPVDMLRRAGLEVKTVTVSGANPVGAHGIEVKCDATVEDIDLNAVDLVILPGGMPGTTNLDASPYTDKVISAMLEKGGGIAAICAAPMILGKRGLLNGRYATCYPGFEGYLEGASVTDAAVVVDSNIITARGMGVATEFAEQIITLLSGKETATEISRAICKNPKKVEIHTDSSYRFPDLQLLSDYGNPTDCTEEARSILDKLSEVYDYLGIRASVKDYSVGPSTINLEIVPERGEKVSRIVNTIDDLSIMLGKESIRAVAPIPGKLAVGLEIPRQKRDIVGLRSLMESEEFLNSRSKTTVCLGRDIYGKAVIEDIAKMPHLLIGGATGMGKSVIINSILTSLICRATPDELKLVLIDPKQVEFSAYKDIPHLLHPIISDPKKAAAILQWAVEEMERRYTRLQSCSVYNIDGYNEKVASSPALGNPMAKIVIIIDELSDLMLQAKKITEELIARIAQKARAAGIYLIIGTQRPSVDVFTGLIRVNVPARICFKVASSVDSKTVIESRGAEKLLNHGDALYSFLEFGHPTRFQAAFISNGDLERLLDDLRSKNGEAVYDDAISKTVDEYAVELFKPKRKPRAKQNEEGTFDPASYFDIEEESEDQEESYTAYDKQFLAAADLAVTHQQISTSLIQRKLSIGYGKAAKFIDIMEQIGLVTAMEGNKPRRVLLTAEEWKQKIERIKNEE